MALTLIIILMLGVHATVSAQETPSDEKNHGGWRVWECVEEEDLEPGFPSTYWFRVVGQELFERGNRHNRGPSCFVKLAVLPISVLAVERTGSFLRLWTEEDEYLYEVRTGSLQRVNAYGTLSSFLDSPIIRVEVSSKTVVGIAGITESSHTSSYRFGTEDTLQPFLRDENEIEPGLSGAQVRSSVDIESLTWALRSVNTNPHHLPTLTDFDFDDLDIRAYLKRVASDVRDGGGVERAERWELYELHGRQHYPTVDRQDIFAELPSQMETISSSVVAMSLLDRFDGGCGYHRNEIVLVNKVGDSIVVSTTSGPSGPRHPFELPWTIRYGEVEFQTFNVELARQLMELLPNYDRDEREEKIDILYAVAWYLGELRVE